MPWYLLVKLIHIWINWNSWVVGIAIAGKCLGQKLFCRVKFFPTLFFPFTHFIHLYKNKRPFMHLKLRFSTHIKKSSLPYIPNIKAPKKSPRKIEKKSVLQYSINIEGHWQEIFRAFLSYNKLVQLSGVLDEGKRAENNSKGVLFL